MRHRVMLGAFALAASVLLRAETPVAPEVRLTLDGKPAAGMRVFLDDASQPTDLDGVARFPASAKPPQVLRVQEPGFRWIERRLEPADLRAPVAVELKAIARADVTVTARVAKGPAVPGARVALTRLDRDAEFLHLEASCGFDGVMAVKGLEAGTWRIEAAAPGCRAWSADREIGGGESGIEVAFEAEAPSASVRGVVEKSAGGGPLAGATVEVLWLRPGAEPVVLAKGTAGGGGAFEIAGIPCGIRAAEGGPAPGRNVVLRASAAGFTATWLAIALDPDAAASARLALDEAPGVVPEAEPNDAAETMQRVPHAATIRQRIEPANDMDKFWFALPSDGIWTLKLAEAPGLMFVSLAARQGMKELANATLQPKKPFQWDLPLRAGDYVLHVQEYSRGTALPAADWEASFRPCADGAEPNEDLATPAPAELGGRRVGYILPAGDVDLFRFTPPSAGTGRFVATAIEALRWSEVRDSGGERRVDVTAQPKAALQAEFGVSKGGACTAHLQEYSRQWAPGAYESGVDFVAADTGDFELRNDAAEGPTPVAPTAFVAATINPVGDRDRYRFEVPESGVVQVRIAPPPLLLWVGVFDAAGAKLGDATCQPGQPAAFEAPLPGRGQYILHVQEYSNGAWSPHPYVVRTAWRPNDVRDRRDNGKAARATPIEIGADVRGQIGRPADEDFYRFRLPRRGMVRTTVKPTPPLLMWSQVLDPTGASAGNITGQPKTPFSYAVHIQRPGWQVLHLKEYSNGAWAREAYSVRVEADLEDPLESASPVRLPARTALPFTILPVGDRDEFVWAVPRAGKCRVTMTGNGLLKWAAVRGRDGKDLVTGTGQPGRELELAWTADAPGDVKIYVQEYGNGAASPEHLWVWAGMEGDAAPPAVKMGAAADPEAPQTWRLTASARAEFDVNGDGVWDATGEEAAREYPGGWVTAFARVTDASGATAFDFAVFHVPDPRADAAVRVAFVAPAPGATVEGAFTAEVEAWTLDGRPLRSVALWADGKQLGEAFREPYRFEVDPVRWAGREIALVAVARGELEARDEVRLTVPAILNLSPPPGARRTSPDVVFEWDTAESSPSEVVVRDEAGAEKRFSGAAGRHHVVWAKGLEQGKGYEWRAVSGANSSAARRLDLVRGIEFAQRKYEFKVERDYDQRVAVRLVNQGDEPAKLQLLVASEQEDLLVGFVGDGSPDRIVELAPHEGRDVALVVSAQDAAQEAHEFTITAEGAPGSGVRHTDSVRVSVAVRMPKIEFTAAATAQDPATLAWDVEIRNTGDRITDLSAAVEGDAAARCSLLPAPDHAALDPGGIARFQVIPTLTPDFKDFAATVRIRAFNVEKRLEVRFEVPAGRRIVKVTIDPVGEQESNTWHCPNRPEGGTTIPGPAGAHVGGPIPGGIRADNLREVRDWLLGWIARRALNPKHQKQMEAILNRWLYEQNGQVQGDARAAMRDLLKALHEDARSELTTWERMFGNGGGPAADDPVRQAIADGASGISTISNAASLAPEVPEIRKAAEQLKYVQEKLAELTKGGATIEQLQLKAAELRPIFLSFQSGVEKIRAAHPEMGNLLGVLATQREKLGRSLDAINTQMAGLKKFSGQLAALQSDPRLARLGNLTKFISVASWVSGVKARYDTLRMQGLDETNARITALISATAYQALTNTPLGAAADIVESAAVYGIDLGVNGLDPKANHDLKDYTLAGTVDAASVFAVWLGNVAFAPNGDEWQEARLNDSLAALPMEKLRDVALHLDRMIAEGKHSSPGELEMWLKARQKIDETLAAKIRDP